MESKCIFFFFENALYVGVCCCYLKSCIVLPYTTQLSKLVCPLKHEHYLIIIVLSDLSIEASVWEFFDGDLVHPFHKPIGKPLLQISVKFNLWSRMTTNHCFQGEKSILIIRTQYQCAGVELPALQSSLNMHLSEPLLCHRQPNQSKIKIHEFDM